MKKNVLLKPIIVISLLLTSCSQDGDFLNANLQAEIDELTSLAQSGTWAISNFIDSGKDETNNFIGYGFSFNSDGSLIANNGSSKHGGTWSITGDDNSNNDNNYDDCNSCTITQLVDVLTSCNNWSVDKLEINNTNIEDSLSGFLFNFSDDGTFTVTANSATHSGTWENTGSGNSISVTLSISDLSEIDDTWTLHEIELENSETKVELRIGAESRLRFENGCSLNNNNTSSNYSDAMYFNVFFANPSNFNELSENWDIVSYSNSKIELIHVSGGNGGTDVLTFEKN